MTKKLANDDGGDIVRTLGERRAEDLRWPLSIFYVKEFKQDSGIPLSEKSEVLPSYRSTVATARQPGRKRSVMQGRVWWVEWWAKEDSRRKERHKIFRNGGKSKKRITFSLSEQYLSKDMCSMSHGCNRKIDLFLNETYTW